MNAEYKKYEIVLLTTQGLKTEIYNTSQPLKEFQKQMIDKYKTFTTYTSKLITN
jgi:hypothetical protein